MSTEDGAPVLFAGEGAIRTCVLNRPKALNALSLEMVRAMAPKLSEWSADDSVKAVVLKGAGAKAFCAGGDVVAVAQSASGALGDGRALAREFFYEEYELDYKIATLPKPVVAVCDGITMGGGVGLSMFAPFRVATENTLFAMPETGIGLFPDVGGSHFLPRLEEGLGMFLALTGSRLKGADVYQAGIATHFIASDRLADLESDIESIGVEATTAQISTNIGAILDGYHEATAEDSSSVDSWSLAPHLDVIRESFTAASVEAIIEKLEAQDPDSEFVAKQLKALGRMSPTSCVDVPLPSASPMFSPRRRRRPSLSSTRTRTHAHARALAAHATSTRRSSIERMRLLPTGSKSRTSSSGGVGR
jgi:3-hydroxyisobutyryl-CoA hydrolase